MGDDYFVVVEREGNKLELGDRLQIQNFILHHPFYARQVFRGEECLGTYSAAMVSGIDTLKLIRNDGLFLFLGNQQDSLKESLPVSGFMCEAYRVKIYGKLHFLKN